MKPLKIKRPPFFKEGTLVFSSSGHALIKSGKYYRCAKDSNQKCGLDEKQILAETLERNFSRKALKLHYKNFPAEVTVQRLLRDHFWDLAFGIDDRLGGKQEVMETTIAVMQQDYEKTKKIEPGDIADFQNTYIESLKADHPVMLFGYAIAIIRAVSSKIDEAKMGRTLAHFTKRVYLSKNGKIEGIELERWVWYLINTVIEKNKPGFLKQIESLNIQNTDDTLHLKGLVEASLSFGEGDFTDAIGEDFIAPIGWIKVMKDTMLFASNGNVDEMKGALPMLFSKIQNDIALNMMMKATSLIKLKT